MSVCFDDKYLDIAYFDDKYLDIAYILTQGR